MSYHYDSLTDIKSTLQSTMKSCWHEGGKLITDNPHDAETYFTIGETCLELITLIQTKQQEDFEK